MASSASAARFRRCSLAPFAGVLVDRWDRHRILRRHADPVDAAVARPRRADAVRGTVTVAVDPAAPGRPGVINAFDTPARQAFVVEMVEDRADLPNAIALNSSMVNGSRIIGPSIGGASHRCGRRGLVLLADAISYIFVIASLLAIAQSRA